MSPHRRHSGGRPRSAGSILDFAEQWGISEKAARRVCRLNLDPEAIAREVQASKRSSAIQYGQGPGRRAYAKGLKALGMRSRAPEVRA